MHNLKQSLNVSYKRKIGYISGLSKITEAWLFNQGYTKPDYYESDEFIAYIIPIENLGDINTELLGLNELHIDYASFDFATLSVKTMLRKKLQCIENTIQYLAYKDNKNAHD